MIVRYAQACFMHHGGDPRLLEELDTRYLLDWLAVHDLLDARGGVGTLPD